MTPGPLPVLPVFQDPYFADSSITVGEAALATFSFFTERVWIW